MTIIQIKNIFVIEKENLCIVLDLDKFVKNLEKRAIANIYLLQQFVGENLDNDKIRAKQNLWLICQDFITYVLFNNRVTDINMNFVIDEIKWYKRVTNLKIITLKIIQFQYLYSYFYYYKCYIEIV